MFAQQASAMHLNNGEETNNGPPQLSTVNLILTSANGGKQAHKRGAKTFLHQQTLPTTADTLMEC